MTRICTVFYSIGDTYRFGFSLARFPRKCTGEMGGSGAFFAFQVVCGGGGGNEGGSGEHHNFSGHFPGRSPPGL